MQRRHFISSSPHLEQRFSPFLPHMMQLSGWEEEAPLPSANRSSTPTSKVSTILQKNELVDTFQTKWRCKKKNTAPFYITGSFVKFCKLIFKSSAPNIHNNVEVLWSLVDKTAAPGGVALHVLTLAVSEAGSLFTCQPLPGAAEPSVQGVLNLNQGYQLTFILCSYY